MPAPKQSTADVLAEWSGIEGNPHEPKDVPISSRIQPDDANTLQTLQCLYNQSRSEVVRAAIHLGLNALMSEHMERNPTCRVRLYDPSVAQQTKSWYESFDADYLPLPTTLAEWDSVQAGDYP